MTTATPSQKPESTEPVGSNIEDSNIEENSSMLSAIVVDDEELARQRVCDLLAKHPKVDVIAECRNGREAVEKIGELKPDLVFLDINMPDLDGFGVIAEIGKDHMPAVIFVTAYDQYAVKAFEAAAVDYLLKPFDRTRFDLAVDKAVDTYFREQVDDLEKRMGKLMALAGGRSRNFSDRLVVRQGGTVHLLKVDEVDWVESARNYVKIHCGSHVYTMRETLSNFEAKLDPERFLRIHRSTVVNIDRIRRIEPGYGSESRLELDNGTKLVISRAYRRGKVKELLEEIL